MKKLMVVLAVLAVVGCQAHTANSPPVANYASVHPQTDHDYLVSAVSAVQSQLYDADLYKGRECNVKLHQVNGKLPDSVSSDGGDSQLCEIAISATKQAISNGSFPYKPASSKFPDNIALKIAP